MFTIYHSNQLDILKSLTAELIKREPTNSVFAPEIILVQSQGMGQWLQMQLATELGIAANIQFPFPNQFIWDIYQVFLPDLPTSSIFDIDSLTWKLLSLLPDLAELPEFSLLEQYISDSNNERKRYQLALNIAALFDQYMVYRPDWIADWQQGLLVNELHSSQSWQAALWQKLIADVGIGNKLIHRADIHQQVMARLIAGDIESEKIARLPKRIFIFGIVSLPPTYLSLFHRLSQYIDIHFMFMNPCRWYWGDIVDSRSINQLIKTQYSNKFGQEKKVSLRSGYFATMKAAVNDVNPLLASWGKLGRDNLSLLQNFNDKKDIEAFVDYNSSSLSLLSSLQQSILDLYNPVIVDNQDQHFDSSESKIVLLPDDDSIVIHGCHSEQREVEVLYDYLLSILDNDSSITLRDCVVMVADIDHYAPHIQAVFDNAPKDRFLSYTISDQKLRYVDPIIQGFFLLLELPESRLELEYIFGLLEIPAIAMRFSIDETKLKQLQNWAVDSGVRWGLESSDDTSYSWFSGLKRMVLGYTMSSESGSWQNILPYDGTTGLDAETVGLLADFIMTIDKWRTILSKKYSMSEWQPHCFALLTDFFIFDAQSEPLLLLIGEQWQAVTDKAILANYQHKVSITILQDVVQEKLDSHYLSHRFLVGKINFCTMMPMRSVPFKVVCLLGMNDGVYPRAVHPLGFDLIAYHSRVGDRSRRNDDRYLFLEALLSAEQKLYISYIGRDIQTNSERYPSILVDELLDYLTQSYVLSGDEFLSLDESAKKLYQHLVRLKSRTPFDSNNFIDKTSYSAHQFSYAGEWLPSARKTGVHSVFFDSLKSIVVDSISSDDLKRFYHHTVRELISARMNYSIGYIEEQLPDSENFNLNGFELYRINDLILTQLLHSDTLYNPDYLYQKLVQSSQLPYGAFGRILFDKQQQMMQCLADRVLLDKQDELSSQEVDLKINNVRLQGWIKNIQSDGILQWRSAKLTIRDGISLWIDHLILSIIKPNLKANIKANEEGSLSRLYGRDNGEWIYRQIDAEQALIILSDLIAGYQYGINQPLFMPLQSAWRWLEIAYDKSTQNLSTEQSILSKAKASFITCWQGGYNLRPECDDYYSRLYPLLTDTLIDNAIDTARCYLLPIMQYRKY